MSRPRDGMILCRAELAQRIDKAAHHDNAARPVSVLASRFPAVQEPAHA